jgi:predicted MFS family arabinose efflux permease
MPLPSAKIPEDAESRSQLILRIGVVVMCRLNLNTARRFAYPFAPALSRGLGVPLTAITSLVAINWATALIGLFFGPVSDRLGYRRMMIAGQLMLIAGMFAGGIIPWYAVVLAALFLAGMAKSIFDPAVQAYVSERVPYRRRGTAIGLLETSWAGSTLVGIPLISLLIDGIGWRAPFFAMGGFGLLGLLAMLWFFPGESRPAAPAGERVRIVEVWRTVGREKSALGVFGYSFLFSIAIDNLFMVYGVWLEDAFQVGIVALGLGTGVIGAAELGGEFLTATLSDRIGLKRAVSLGVAVCTLSYIVLPLAAQSLTGAFCALFFHFLLFEFTIVSSFSLCTELRPDLRATVIAGFLAAAGLGRVAGALIGIPVWLAGGITATGATSACLSLAALFSLRWGLKSWSAA